MDLGIVMVFKHDLNPHLLLALKPLKKDMGISLINDGWMVVTVDQLDFAKNGPVSSEKWGFFIDIKT